MSKKVNNTIGETVIEVVHQHTKVPKEMITTETLITNLCIDDTQLILRVALASELDIWGKVSADLVANDEATSGTVANLISHAMEAEKQCLRLSESSRRAS